MAINPEESNQASEAKRPARKGFQVGPQNLPDGPQRRKFQKIKHDLIRKAQLQKELSRAKATVESTSNPIRDEVEDEPTSLEPHPDRQALIESATQFPPESSQPQLERPRQKRFKPQTFNKEAQDAERRQNEREAAEAARKKKLKDRERLQRAVAKARKPGKDGKRRLGREGAVLLEKVKRFMNN